MKNNLWSTLTRFFLMVVLFSVSTTLLWSQQATSQEILVYVKPNTIDVPINLATDIGLTSASVRSPAFLATLQRFHIQNMKRAFSGFNLADTLRYTQEGKAIRMLNLSHLYKITVPAPYERDSVVTVLNRLPDVVYAERNGGWKLHTNDPSYGKQWYLKNTGQSGGTVGTDIKAENAWQIFTGSSQIKIGIIDSGIKTDHEDLSGKVTGDNPDYNWHDPYWYYSYAHGTHVAGIASAKTNNSIGIAGVDQNAQIYSRRIFDSQNHQSDNTFIYNAVVDAVNQGCNVLNNSWGRSNYSTTIRAAFAYAYKMNRVAVCSMGNNNGSQTQYPAGFGEGIIAVGSTQDNDVVSTFSDIGNHIDVAAPGGSGSGDPHDIFSTVAYYNSTYGGYYDFLAGTSMAAPVVTGIASLLKGYNSNLYNDDIERIIQLSADKVRTDLYTYDPNGWNINIGYGRVNAQKALNFLQAPYQLSQLSAYGGTDYSSTGSYNTVIYGASGLSDGVYLVKRHEVRTTISFAPMYDHSVWGRGVGTNGWSLESPNYSMGFCELVSGTLTSSSATLRTYVYEVWDIAGQWMGWYPTTASNVSLNYTVLGKQLIAPVISSFVQTPNPIPPGVTGTVVPVLSQGNGPITYSWSYISKPTWVTVWFSRDTAYVRNDLALAKTSGVNSVLAPAFELTCIASNAAGSSTRSYQPILSSTLVKEGANTSDKLIVTETKLESNFPNPFNPSTVIKYQIKEKAPVSIKVFDIMGREVTTLVHKYQDAGAYEVIFDASNLPSGVYFYNLTTGSNSITKKMMLVK